ncbi:MAG: hypothetical protein HRT89_01670 [Lentisphaeria bacterium]|nr:hypothetical protein [Lentisphaeria bacterium]NQZ66755.1 hypothetical protein [Lentisphaeria bacterium]
MEDKQFDYQNTLRYQRKKALSFNTFVDNFLDQPDKYLHTSATIISDAIKYFGYEIVIRSGEPILSYNIFKDPFSNGINAVYGQELGIKAIVDAIESVEKEAGPKRGIVLVGPPASGKTNVIDLISRAIVVYTKQNQVRLYSFYFNLPGKDGRNVQIRCPFMNHPLLLFPTIIHNEDGQSLSPRSEMLEHLKNRPNGFRSLTIPTYYRYATLDKRNQDIIEALQNNPRNEGKTLYEIFDEYIMIEEIEFSVGQGKGIANIDDMRHLQTHRRQMNFGHSEQEVLNEHLPGLNLYTYEGAMVSSHRGLLHMHDAFGIHGGQGASEEEYKPLLMLLGSGKIALESTQTSIDNTVVITTNLEEMDMLENQLASAKLLDRIEKIPINYLLDTTSETEILKRDMANIKERYDVDPNLLRIAAYFSVITRLQPPVKQQLPSKWSSEKKSLFYKIRPEQKLFIYSSKPQDPIQTLKQLPHWHPFRNECLRVGINIFEPELYRDKIVTHPEAVSLEKSNVFTNNELKLLDDEFMRFLLQEHYPNEGRSGLSIRQLQNIIRNTFAKSDGSKVTVNLFFTQLERIITEGPSVHHWLSDSPPKHKDHKTISSRKIDELIFKDGEGDYGDFKGLIAVVKALYYMKIKDEITIATVDRDPERIESDLRKYLQHALLARAHENKAFSHILIPRFTYVDKDNGEKIDHPDENYMISVESVIDPDSMNEILRSTLAQKFLDLNDSGELKLEEEKTLVGSRDDNFLDCFSNEYNAMLSHRKAIEGVSSEQLRNGFFHKQNSKMQYNKLNESIKHNVESIIQNMVSRFSYSKEIALDTIVFALRQNILDFSKIIN